MKATKTYFKSAGPGCTQFEYFKHERKEVAIFQNLHGSWTAEGPFRQVVAPTREEAISAYKAHDKALTDFLKG